MVAVAVALAALDLTAKMKIKDNQHMADQELHQTY
jgi:hypothetical protein